MRKVLLIIAGFLSLAVGAVGIVLPVLPTTPFVLVSASCFSLSSEKLYGKLINNKFFGEYIRHYKEKTGVRLSFKIFTLIFLYLTLTISAVLIKNLIVTIILILVAVFVTIHILTIKTKKH